jgi:hypothetical protein
LAPLALGVLSRLTNDDDWRVTICTPTPKVTSMNSVVIEQMSTLEEALDADAVIVGSGIARGSFAGGSDTERHRRADG